MIDPPIFDAVIIGGGPAGISMAIWCADLGLKACLVERGAELGGQLLRIYNKIENYPGVRASNGRELCERFLAQASATDCVMHLSSDVERIDVDQMSVVLSSGEIVRGKNLVIATGVSRRRLGVPGETEFVGRGIMESGSLSPESVAGERVAIVGGGDAALENAVNLSRYGERVYVVHRRDGFSARSAFIEAARSASNVEFLLGHNVTSITGNETVSAIELEVPDSNGRISLPVQKVLIRIGVEPNSKLVRSLLPLDGRGYIPINSLCETGIPSLYAIGDVADPIAPTISGAAGNAATAAKAIAAKIYG